MPTYQFRDVNTQEVFEKFMKTSEKETYLKENPHVQQILGATNIVSGVGGVHSKVPDGFNEVLQRIKSGSGKKNTINTK